MGRDVFETADAWIAHDVDEGDRAALSATLEKARAADADARAELESAFAGPLAFGTAGLRGRIGPGESRMNRSVVIRATAGLAAYLHDVVGEQPRLVVGFDARHGSEQFARDVAAVATAAGCAVDLMPAPLPTPVLAFAVRHLDADAGVMVTASHNPAADNGYKVYLGGRAAAGSARGVQIVPPSDALIAEGIAAAPPADEVARAPRGWRVLGPDVADAYLDRAVSLRGEATPSDLRIVLTPMHGVGGAIAEKALGASGFGHVHVVAEQAAPDPDFPTVPFPNPEERGALDLATSLAREVDADLVIALDPDADRCAVAVPDPDTGWRQLTGDQLGALLGEQAAAATELVPFPGGTLANSIVSGRLLGKIAAHHGLEHATTLTGFKWIARVEGLVFGYEEAIGYCTDPEAVRDKDGITAAVRVAALADTLARSGRTLTDALDDLARVHGLHATAPVTFRFDDLSRIGAAMSGLRANPPVSFADSPVVEVRDLADGIPELDLPPTDGMLFVTAADDRVVVRPSGTEPKLKCYLEVVLPCADGEVPHAAARDRLDRLAADVRALLG